MWTSRACITSRWEAAGCTILDSVLVEQSADAPMAVAAAAMPDVLTCTVLSVQLDATASAGGTNLSYQWTGNVSDPTSPTPTTTEPGVYQLTVTNLDNGCSDMDDIEIFQDIEDPEAVASASGILSCTVPVVSLDWLNVHASLVIFHTNGK